MALTLSWRQVSSEQFNGNKSAKRNYDVIGIRFTSDQIRIIKTIFIAFFAVIPVHRFNRWWIP